MILKEKIMENKLYNYLGERIYKYLSSGMTYREIANKYYYRDLNKFLSELHRVMTGLRAQNRRHLLYLAYENNLIT